MFCINKYVDTAEALRVDFDSLSRGLKWCYDGYENPALAYFIYEHLGNGNANHIITFSEFLYFASDFTLSKEHQNLVIFYMLTERQKILTVQSLLRSFVNIPQYSDFAVEIRDMLAFYTEKTLIADKDTKSTVRYDKNLFNTLIPYSVLATELRYLTIDLPKLAFQQDGEPNPDFEYDLEI